MAFHLCITEKKQKNSLLSKFFRDFPVLGLLVYSRTGGSEQILLEIVGDAVCDCFCEAVLEGAALQQGGLAAVR